MPTEETTKPRVRAKPNSAPPPHISVIRRFLDQTREAFKTTLQQLADHGVMIRSFTELHDHVVDVEKGLPITQQLIVQAYRHAVLVSTVEALFKETNSATSSTSAAASTRKRRDERQE